MAEAFRTSNDTKSKQRAPDLLDDLDESLKADAKKKGPSLAERNNNPGNIEWGPFAKSMGATGPGEGGRFARFPTREAGSKAKVALLQRNYKGMSPAQVIQKYSPWSKENSEAAVRNYIGYISARAGVDPDKPLDAAGMAKIAPFMGEFESGKTVKTNFKPYGGGLKWKGGGTPPSQKGGGGNQSVGTFASDPVVGGGGIVQVKESQFAGVAAAPVKTDGKVGDKADAFSLDPKARTQAATVSQAGDFLGQVFTATTKGISQIQADEKQLLQAKVDANEQLLEAQAQETQARMDTLRPMFARREAIAQRQVEIQEMGWFERTFAGMFNRNYNKGYLENLDSAIANQIDENTKEWEIMSANREQLGNLLNERYTDESSINKLMESHLLQNVGLASQAFNISNQQLSATLQQVNVDQSLVNTQADLKQVALRQIVDVGSITTLLTQAKANGGSVMVNGTPISEAELIQHGKTLETQDAQMKLLQLSLANGEQGLIDRQMESVVASLTPEQRQEAAANGGKLKDGTQLNSKILAEYIQTDTQLAASATQGALVDMAGSGVYDNTRAWANGQKQTVDRYASIFGRGESPLFATMTANQTAMTEAMNRLKAMPEGPAKSQLEAQVQEMLGKAQAQESAVLDAAIKTYSKDGNAQALVKGYITGTGVSPEQAVKGFLALTKGGTAFPKLDPRSPAAPVIAAMIRAADGVYKRNGGEANAKAILAGKDKQSAAELQASLMTAVKNAATSNWSNNAITDFIDTAPKWAAADKHPAGRIRPEDLRMSRAKGDQLGYQAMAAKLSWTPQEVQAVFGPGGAGVNSPKVRQAGFDEKKVRTLKSELAVLQTQGMIQTLDASKSAAPGFRPSTALADFMQSQNFQGRVNAYSQNASQMGFAENTIATITGTATLGAQTTAYGKAFGAAASQNDAMNFQRAKENAAMYRNQPLKRTRAIIAGLEGFDPRSEEILFTAIQGKYKGSQMDKQQQTSANAGSRSVVASVFGLDTSGVDLTGDANAYISQIILNSKFEDPTAESLRKKAAAQWTKTSSSVDRAINALD